MALCFLCIDGDYTNEVYSPDGIAYDWIGKKVYWTDSRINRIFSMNIDRTHRTTLAVTQRPRAIVLDPCRGLVQIHWLHALMRGIFILQHFREASAHFRWSLLHDSRLGVVAKLNSCRNPFARRLIRLT